MLEVGISRNAPGFEMQVMVREPLTLGSWKALHLYAQVRTSTSLEISMQHIADLRPGWRA